MWGRSLSRQEIGGGCMVYPENPQKGLFGPVWRNRNGNAVSSEDPATRPSGSTTSHCPEGTGDLCSAGGRAIGTRVHFSVPMTWCTLWSLTASQASQLGPDMCNPATAGQAKGRNPMWRLVGWKNKKGLAFTLCQKYGKLEWDWRVHI